jgi:predicted AAA+ superfamily ATPase
MAQSNHERVQRALELLKEGLRPFVERELEAEYGAKWPAEAAFALKQEREWQARGGEPNFDSQALLSLIANRWNEVFGSVLGRAERNLVSELRDVRNRWAHQEPFSTDDAYRALDSAARLLAAISAPEAQEVERQKQELLRQRFEEQARKETRRASVASVQGTPATGLRPWREVVTPHPDVASGRYQQAEFTADLGQVYRGEGSDEYRHPREFFQRTFLTDGLKHLLARALERLAGQGGDPVVGLQTNFGGGKTHSMLALYHLFSGVPLEELPGIEPVLKTAGVARPPAARRAVLVGQALSPGQARAKPDGTVTRTLWGELAWQLLGPEGFELVAEADRLGVSPGSDSLRELFTRAAPCLVLIDEWLVFVRQLYTVHDLPAGSFDANLGFVQALTEAAKAAPHTLVVGSLPASDMEAGGEGGREALARIQHLFGRVESVWRPASAEEGFEIVRRRLFQPILDGDLCKARDAVARAFAELYRGQPGEFPTACREAGYARRIQAAYPIHPELFDRLYNDWSTLDRFQRTRGVLRLMAAVIHELWERQDGGLLILPASVPLDAGPVQSELTRYLEDQWAPVIDTDVDGPRSLPLALDRDNPNLGRYSACRRVARTIYLGSAPTLHSPHKGLEDRQIKLGCAQPGESPATFGDALRRLTDGATYLYVDGQRYWLATRPSVTRLAQDRAMQYSEDAVAEEIERRLREARSKRGEFASVHPCPSSSADVPDEREARLVILRPEQWHAAKAEESPARRGAAAILEGRGTGPRLCRNAIVFLAPDRARLSELEQGVRQYLAWKSIEAEREPLNLDVFQANQAKTKRESADETVQTRISETYCWLLVPEQSTLQGDLEWSESRLQGSDPLAVRASRKLLNEERLLTKFAATRLRMELDRVPLWRGDHVGVKQLADDFAQYLYLPRLRDTEVLVAAVQDGLGRITWEEHSFAYADGWDASGERYRGLTAGQHAAVILNAESVLVKPEAAAKQLEAEAARQRPTGSAYTAAAPEGGAHRVADGGPQTETPGATATAAPTRLGRFHGSVTLDASRLGRDAGKIAEEVVQHLSVLRGARVEVTLEIDVEIPDGAPEQVVRTVTENCRTLRFKNHGFEAA